MHQRDAQANLKENHMRRFVSAAAAVLALSIPLTAATVGFAGTAGAVSKITCTSLKGTITGTVTIGACTPSGGPGYKTASGSAASLAGGGKITWKTSKATTTIGNTSAKQVTPNKCPAGSTEYAFTGKVTAASTKGVGIPAKGDAVSAKACVSAAGNITILKGTTMKL
jgi:hypothetical protein